MSDMHMAVHPNGLLFSNVFFIYLFFTFVEPGATAPPTVKNKKCTEWDELMKLQADFILAQTAGVCVYWG